MNQEFESLIANHHDLNDLLHHGQIGVFSNFTDEKIQTPECKEYIEERYLTQFTKAVAGYKSTEQDGLVLALFRSIDFLATPQAKEKLFQTYQPEFLQAKQNLSKVFDLLQVNDIETIKQNVDDFDQGFSPDVLGFINNLADPTSHRYELDSYFQSALAIADNVSKVKATDKNFDKYAMFNAAMNNLKKVKTKMNEEHLKQYYALERNIEQKRDKVDRKANLWIYVFVALIVFRILRIIARNMS